MSVTGAQDPIQERTRAGLPGHIGGIGAALAVLLSACAAPSSINPVDWWHNLEGGQIAQARPPPPNADAPYPNLASVPARPATAPSTSRTQVATRLLANRTNATYAAAQAPLTAASSTPPRPSSPAAGPPTQQSEPLGARLQAASAPPPPPSPTPTHAAALPPTASTQSAPQVATAPLPPIPAGPPPPPNLPGVSIAAQTAPSPSAVAPPAPPPSVVPASTAAVSVPFAGGSATLSPADRTALQKLAQRHGAAAIAVTGYGEAPSTVPSDQATALPLAWSRAQAIAGALETAGVPPAMLRLTAEASGRGGLAALVE